MEPKPAVIVTKKQKSTAQYYTLTKPSSFTSVSLTPPLQRQNSQSKTVKKHLKKRKA